MIKILIPLLVALESADGIFTYFKVSKDLVHEANPILQSIAGTDSFLIMKICGALLCGVLLWLVYRRFPRVSFIATSSILLFYTAVLTWNLFVLL
jgi:hypothetical protein